MFRRNGAAMMGFESKVHNDEIDNLGRVLDLGNFDPSRWTRSICKTTQGTSHEETLEFALHGSPDRGSHRFGDDRGHRGPRSRPAEPNPHRFPPSAVTCINSSTPRRLSGAVTLVAAPDKTLHLDATGKADLDGDKPMRPDTLFWIASMTKPITATAVLMLQDEGKLSVDDPVEKYLPEFAKLKTAQGEPARVTIRHLLTHTSGLGEIAPQWPARSESGRPDPALRRQARCL